MALNGGALAGVTSSPLVLTNVQLTNAGFYAVLVTNSSGSITTNPVRLDVGTCVAASAGGAQARFLSAKGEVRPG
jgi:hypothetical protein